MMKKAVIFFLTSLLFSILLLDNAAVAQRSYCYGIDPSRDSIAFAQFRVRMDSIRQLRPTVALVLSGGGAKGAAHIPILSYLDSIQLPIDLVMGTSIGGLLGGLYAVGYSGHDMEKMMRSQNWNYIMRDTHPRRYDALVQKDYDSQFQFDGAFGLRIWDIKEIDNHHENVRRSLLADGMVHGRNVEDLIASLIVGYSDTCDFLQLPTPFVCVATDMVTAKPKIWHSGSLVTALRSSMSIPGYFTPVKQNGMVLLDGSMRSNMPAEIARKLGADIIITVDISTPALNASQINSLLDIVYQASDVMAREAYEAGLAATDIYIQPDVSGFSLLSFDSASVSELISRGRMAVAKHADNLNALAERLGPRQQPTNRIINIDTTFVTIDTVICDGLSPMEANNIRKMLRIKDQVSRFNLEDAVSTLIGTRTFEKVTYQLLGDTNPYKLHFSFRRSPLNEIGASARFDAIDYASLLLHLGLGAHALTGSRYDITLRLGLNTYAKLGYTYRSGHGVDFGVNYTLQHMRDGGWIDNENELSINFNRSNINFYAVFMPFKQMRMQIGTRIDNFYLHNFLADSNFFIGTYAKLFKSNTWPVFYAQLRSDSFDDAYFPESGMKFMGYYSWSPGEFQHNNDKTDFHIWHLSYITAITSERVTILPFFETRYISATVVPYINMLSANDANRCLDQQITFMGINQGYSALRTLGTLGMNFRRRIGERHYVTGGMQFLRQAKRIEEIFKDATSKRNVGMSIEYAYYSMAGPIRFNIHWSSLLQKLGFYFGLGLDF